MSRAKYVVVLVPGIESEIIYLPILAGNRETLEWVGTETTAG
jgi:hypothetical protein